MRIFWASLAVGILALGSLRAEFNHPIFCGEIASGYRQDSLTWGFHRQEGSSSSSTKSKINTTGTNLSSIFNGSVSSSNDDLLFHQDWKTIRIAETTCNFSYTTCNNYYARINGGYGHIMHGEVNSKAFTNLLDPQELTAKIHADGRYGEVMDYEGCVGYQFTSNGRRVVATPVIGYSWHSQCLKMKHATQEYNALDIPARVGKIDRLNFSYKPHWYGMFAGLDFMVMVENPCFVVYGFCEWHWSDKYRAKGKWHLRDHVFHDAFDAHFEDHAIGHGLYGSLGINYRIGCGWYLGIVGYYRHFQAHHGRHDMKKLFSDIPTSRQNFGTIPVLGSDTQTHLQRVNWVSWSAAISVDYRYYDP